MSSSDKPRKDAKPTSSGQGSSDEPVIRSMDLEEFVRRLHADTSAEKRFAFFLGAGCSVASGIPTAGSLVKDRWIPRLRDLKAPKRSDMDAWAKEAISGYEPEAPAHSYGELIDLLFITAEDRQREIEDLCDGRIPSFGYAVLAQLIAQNEGRFNLVLTTNFDDMIADALYLYTDARPLVIHHESLAAFIRPTRTRPLVVKLHGDHRLSPRNTALETEKLEQAIQSHTAMALHDRGIIFMGYSGADIGILKLLEDLPSEALPFGAYWIHPDEPHGPVREWLSKRKGIWVRSGWFDEVMLLIQIVFALPHPTGERFTRIFQDYMQKYNELFRSIQEKPADEAGVQALKNALTDTEALFPHVWRVLAEARRLELQDPDKANKVYLQGISQFPDDAILLGGYANFLRMVQKDINEAEVMYKRALDIDPKHANNLGNYALFLEYTRKDYDAAEAMYKRALEVNPKDAHNLGIYAVFLEYTRKDYDAAEAMYKRALEADPKHTRTLGSYANFLCDNRKDYDAAETMYKRALDIDPKHANNLGNYANFLKKDRKDYDAAETMYKRALEADPKAANILGSYALFLDDNRKDYDAAEAMYKRALEVDPKHTNNLGNYALFLKNDRKDYNAAEAMYKRALEADPKDANILGNYAYFLCNDRKDYDAAEAMYERALEDDPKDANLLGHYANFLCDDLKDYDGAEAMYKRALEIAPKHANNRGNLARLLLASGKVEGHEVLDQAIASLKEIDFPVLELECAFYLYAHGQPTGRMTALQTIRKLVDDGVSSPGWDLSRNTDRAVLDGHPEGPWLPKLAAVINGVLKPSQLSEWPAWQDAAA